MNGAGTASALADLYGLFGEVLSFPGDELRCQVESGGLRRAVEHLAGHLPFRMEASLEALAQPPASAAELEAEYIRLFDVPDRVPTPLYSGVFARQRRDAMEELLRFYRLFGLTVNKDAHDLPDYVPTVLEFLRFLALGAAQAAAGGSAGHERATADVLERHLCPWTSQTLSRLRRRDAHGFYLGVVEALDDVAHQQLGQLRAVYPGG